MQTHSTKKERVQGIYKPRLNLINRVNAFGSRETLLKIELSLPKLLFGNNFDELQPKDFNSLITKLINAYFL